MNEILKNTGFDSDRVNMGKSSILSLIIIFFFCSCDDKQRIILYEYNGEYVTRIDNGTESDFYYGKHEDGNNLPRYYVNSTFSGFNSGMDAYLIFKPKNISVYYSMGYFTNVGSVKNIKIINEAVKYNFHDSVNGRYNNVCRMSNILTLEQELNAKNHSKVIVTYPPD